MKFDTIGDLERLASLLETKSATAEAKAQEHAKLKEITEAERETRRATGGRHFAAVCRDAARRLTTKQKRGNFIAPSWEELLDYCKEKHPVWPHADMLSWWNHFESCGWKIGKGKPMVNWRKAADNGFLGWKEKNPQRATTSHTATAGNRAPGDPEGWREFLVSLSRPYVQFRYEQEWVRSDFQAAQRARK